MNRDILDDYEHMGMRRTKKGGEFNFLQKENDYLKEEIEKLKAQMPKEESFVNFIYI